MNQLALVTISLIAVSACSPGKKRDNGPVPAVDIRIVDPKVGGSVVPQEAIGNSIGNLWIELQEDAASKKQNLFLKASFHEGIQKNIFMESLPPQRPVDDHDHDHDEKKPDGEEKKDKDDHVDHDHKDEKSEKKEEGHKEDGHDHKDEKPKKKEESHEEDGHDHEDEKP